MTLAHICYGSALFRAISFVPWIDGASGFILISGLVLGMLCRRRTDTTGVASAEVRLARRTVLLYASHVALTTLTVLVSLATATPDPTLPDYPGYPAVQIAGWLVSMQVNPQYIDILSMYVVLLALAMIWVPMLRRGRWAVVLASSTALYGIAVLTDWGRFPDQPDGWSYFNTAAWQALFGTAFVAGWYWLRIGEWLRSPAAFVSAVGIGLLVAAAGFFAHHVGAGTALFEKTNCGLGRITLAWAAFVVLYQLARSAVARAPALVIPIALIGSRSLACFIALCVVETLLPLVIGADRTTPVAQIAGILTVLAMYPVARGRGVAGDLLTDWRRRLSPA